MQSPETKAAGDAVGFGSAFLFACVFGMFCPRTSVLMKFISDTEKSNHSALFFRHQIVQ
jgi:hypothetical protein